jgi:hypothetical protein
MNTQESLGKLRTALGYKPLSRLWAKVEILLGLAAAGAGLLVGNWQVARGTAAVDWFYLSGGLSLFVMGGYLALAGNRSHLYQSSNELTAYLAEEIRGARKP